MLDRPPPAAARSRALRRARDRRQYRRELAGRKIAPVEYAGAVVDYLVKYGWLGKDKTKNRNAIGDAISRAMQEAAEADAK